MAEDTENTNTPSEVKKDDDSAGKSTLIIVVVAALLLIGGVFLLNQLTKGEEENTSNEATEETTNDEESTNETTEPEEASTEPKEENTETTPEEQVEMTSEEVNAIKEKLDAAFTGEKLTTLAAALKATNLDEALAKEASFTILAPSEEAFKNLPKGTLEALLKDPQKLAEILKYHVINKKITSEQILDGEEEKTLQGGVIVFSKDEKGNVTVEGAKVVKADIDKENGVIHIIDTVLIPE